MTYQITESDIEAFTEGDCWALAREINKRTGWKVIALGAYPEDAERKRSNFDWVHVFVQTPDGNYLDVEGLADANWMVDRYENHVFGKYDWEPEYFDFEEIALEKDWDAMQIRYRIFPQVPVAKVAASLIRAYRDGSLADSARSLVWA